MTCDHIRTVRAVIGRGAVEVTHCVDCKVTVDSRRLRVLELEGLSDPSGPVDPLEFKACVRRGGLLRPPCTTRAGQGESCTHADEGNPCQCYGCHG